MPYIKKDFIERLIDRVDIVDVIGSRITLKRSGNSYMCCCPFHNEKTPSFSVNQQKQFFNCFGCHKSGNVLGFIMDYDQLSFPEAVEQLAKDAGVPVEYEESSGKTQEKREYDVDFYELLGAETNLYMFVGDKKVIVKAPSYVERPTEEFIRVPAEMERAHFFDKETELAIVH